MVDLGLTGERKEGLATGATISAPTNKPLCESERNERDGKAELYDESILSFHALDWISVLHRHFTALVGDHSPNLWRFGAPAPLVVCCASLPDDRAGSRDQAGEQARIPAMSASMLDDEGRLCPNLKLDGCTAWYKVPHTERDLGLLEHERFPVVGHPQREQVTLEGRRTGCGTIKVIVRDD